MKQILIFTLLFTSLNSQAEEIQGNSNITYIGKKKSIEAPKPSGPFEWQSIEYYASITPKIFFDRLPSDDLARQINRAPHVNLDQAKEILDYIAREEFYKHDISTTEQHLKNRFDQKPIMHEGTRATAIYEIHANHMVGYQALKIHDSMFKTDFSQRAALAYLPLVLSQHRSPNYITQRYNLILSDFLTNMRKFPSQSAIEVAEIAKMAIEYFENKLANATEVNKHELKVELQNVARQASNFSTHLDNPFYQKYFHSVHLRYLETNFNIKEKISEFKEKEERKKIQEAASKNKKNLEHFQRSINNFITISNGDFDQSKTQITFEEGVIEVEFVKHYPVRPKGNVTEMPNKGDFRRIYTVRVIVPSASSSEAIFYATQTLLNMTAQIHGVYFDDKLRIPSELNLNRYEVTNIGQSRVLIRNVPLTCPQLFL